MPGRLSGVVPSPQSRAMLETVPSGSVAVNATATFWPALAGVGETLVTDTAGGLSLMVSVAVPEPAPALLAAVTVIVNVSDLRLPVFAYTCVSEAAVPGRLSGADPSPQSTVTPVTVAVLETAKVTVTVSPVLAEFGVGVLTETVGAPTGIWIVIGAVAWPRLPALSVAVTVIAKEPAVAYEWASVVAVPARLSGAVPSPQSTLTVVTVPSGSAAEKVRVTVAPVWAGFGITLVIVIVGTLSFTASVVVPEPGPALFVAVTVSVNTSDLAFPVDAYM